MMIPEILDSFWKCYLFVQIMILVIVCTRTSMKTDLIVFLSIQAKILKELETTYPELKTLYQICISVA